jgi:very-short-patch-repair endonuclease
MKGHNLHSKKTLFDFRNKLRNRSTSAEATFWDLVKSRKLFGRKFRRQHSIGPYIVDFYCPSEKLIIELDGNPHGEYYNIYKDTKRDKYLQDLGFTVLRFENRFVFQEPEYVLKEIADKFNQPPRPLATPP